MLRPIGTSRKELLPTHLVMGHEEAAALVFYMIFHRQIIQGITTAGLVGR